MKRKNKKHEDSGLSVKVRIVLALTLIFAALSVGARAQSKTVRVTGQILGPDGDPLVGAFIIANKSTSGAATDANGSFSYEVDASKFPLTLTAKFIGFQDQTFVVYDASQADLGVISLDDEGYSLNEVVATGYGQQMRKKLTGAVSKVSEGLIQASPKDAPALALQGNASGVYVEAATGAPGGGATTIQIRGVSTLTSQNDPLYIIDGVPFNSSPKAQTGYTSTGIFGMPDALSLINPNDIASIEILKDADATAIYGTKGANGVVLITTKKGREGDIRVNLNINTTAQFVTKRLDFLDTEEYVALRKQAFQSDLEKGIVKESDMNENNFPDLFLWEQDKTYDWQEELLGNTAWATEAELNISGGNKHTTFRLSGAYYHSGTVTVGKDKYKRYSGRLNVHHSTPGDKVVIDASMGVSALNLDADAASSGYTSLNTAPNRPFYDEDGSPYWIPDDTGDSAPLSILNFDGTNKVVSLTSSLNGSYKIWEELVFKVTMGYNASNSRQDRFYYRSYYNPYKDGQYAIAQNFSQMNTTFIVEPQLSYDFDLGKGRGSVLVGVSKHNDRTNTIYMRGQDYPGDMFLKDANAAAAVTYHSTPKTQTENASFFAKASYDFMSRYIVNGNFRRDGSSRFGANNHYGNFYSVGAAWLFTNESFIADNAVSAWLSHGKLRVSYGKTGNDGISDYTYIAKYLTDTYPYEGKIGIYPTNIANDDLHWETTNKFDVGLEVGFLKDRIVLSGNYYKNVTTDLLRSVTLPTQTGFSSITANMDAEIQNYGAEFELNTTNIKSDQFIWTTSLNVSVPRNKLTKYEGLENSSYRNSYEIDKSINIVRRYKCLGIDEETGLAEIEDANGDGKLDTQDYQDIGDTDPKIYGGMTNTFKFKGFTLDFTCFFRKVDCKIGYLWNFYSPIGNMANVTHDQADNCWKKPGDKAKYPGMTTSTSGDAYKNYFNYYSYSDAAYSNASFFRLNNVRLAYDFPTSLIARAHMSHLQVYVQGKNLILATKYDSLDPETGTAVPPSKGVTFGLSATF